MSESYTEHEEELARMLGEAEWEREQLGDDLEEVIGIASFLFVTVVVEATLLAVLGLAMLRSRR